MAQTKADKTNIKTPGGKPAGRWRTIGLQVLFIFALGIFGFSLVSYLAGPGDGSGGVIMLALDEENSDVIEVEADEVSPGYALFNAFSPRSQPELTLSPVFSPSIQYWRDDLLRWGDEYSLDPNLLATVMQIESCGYPLAGSSAGAQGLFQVMPFHFDEGEEMTDPDTNAMRGAAYLVQGLEISGGHAGLALAGYNGGHSVINRAYTNWPNETQRYYRWGGGIYREASAGWASSPTLSDWWSAGGSSLCAQAEQYLGVTSDAY